MKSDRTVVNWAMHYDFLNKFHPTNVPLDLTNVVAMAAGMEHNQALLADGTVRVWGRAGNPGMAVPLGLTNVLATAASWHQGLALLEDATIVRWGWPCSRMAP